MKTRQTLQAIIHEIRTALAEIDEEQTAWLVKRIVSAQRIFVAGTGRSGLMVRAFAVRLMHLGYTTFVVGETVTPSLQKGDLLIIGSGSGETGTIRVIAEKAKKTGAGLALITAFPQSSIGKLADVIITLRAPTTKGLQPGAFASIQPMGSLFEQCLLLYLDLIVMLLMAEGNISSDAISNRHANLE